MNALENALVAAHAFAWLEAYPNPPILDDLRVGDDYDSDYDYDYHALFIWRDPD